MAVKLSAEVEAWKGRLIDSFVYIGITGRICGRARARYRQFTHATRDGRHRLPPPIGNHRPMLYALPHEPSGSYNEPYLDGFFAS